MSTWVLSLRQTMPLRLDLRAVAPLAFARLPRDEIERQPITHGNDTLPLAELFHLEDVSGDDVPAVVLQGDVSRCDRIGWQLAGGRIDVRGHAGDYLGAGMTAGEIHVAGNAGVLAACEMQGGLLEIEGNVGDFAAAALPGSMDGMRGGTLIVRGNAAQRFGDRMRRGTALVFGDAGDFLGSRLVAGSIAVGGRIGAHCAWGMRRGSIVCAGAAPPIAPTFVATHHDIGVFWQLLARDLARFGGPFAELPARRVERFAGDLAADGKGELLLPR